ncbi:MAG TPA: hypothetical protein VET46_16805 [Steroidobacteraceae bacterium]|nr:hypothetical protein [Steroidobacteraceae bacterium]
MGDQRSAGSPPRGRRGEIITGRLQEHGKANYQFQADGSPSYYLTLLTSRGPETLWGTDLERAIVRSESQPKIGAVVGVQRVGSDPVTIPARDGERKTDKQRTFYRARWRVEEVTHLAKSMQSAERAVKSRLEDKRAMTERPELRSAFISLGIARKFAAERIRDPADRELFVQRIEALLANSSGKRNPSTDQREPSGIKRGREGRPR